MEYKLSFQDLQVVTLKWSLFMRDYYKTCKSPLSGNQSYVLSCYYFLPQITIREICANLEISKQQMTKILAVLEKQGMIRRRYGEGVDKRELTIEVTDAGRAYVEGAFQKTTAFLNENLHRMPEEEQNILWQAVQIMLKYSK